MRSRRPARPDLACASVTICLLLFSLPVSAAKTPRRGPAATATGPAVERTLPMLGAALTLEAGARADAQDAALAGRGADQCLAEAVRWAALLEPGDPASELARLNRAADADRAPCSPELFAVLDTARALAAQTDGAFDPTCGALLQAWDLRGAGRVPAREALADARLVTGWRMLLLEPGRRTARFMKSGVRLALDGLDRGFVLDRAAEAARAAGIRRARLQLGEVVLALSAREPYSAVVDDPAEPGRAAFQFLLANGALSTATQGGQGFTERGVHYGPILDPRRGAPVAEAGSVTVVARSAARAQALARALLVMGREGALDFARGHPDLGVLWLEHDGATLQAWGSNLAAFQTAPDLHVRWMAR